MPSRFADVTKKEISQLIKQAIPEIHEEKIIIFCSIISLFLYVLKQLFTLVSMASGGFTLPITRPR